MKKLSTVEITDSASMPLKSGSLEFLQEAHRETTTALVVSMLGFTPNNITPYIINGCQISNAGSLYSVTAGYIYYNGEIFKVNSSSFNLGGGEQVWGKITNVSYPSADPVLFGDNVLRNVHLDRVVVFESNTSGDILYINSVRTEPWQTGDIKEVDCTPQYIIDNFEVDGLGKNERQGWAICNGNNGTKNRTGRVGIAYGTTYPTIGATGGTSTHILSVAELPPHHHRVPTDGYTRGTGGSNTPVPSNGFDDFAVDTLNTGSGAAHNNMQPYIVTLVIQKINS